MSIKVQCESCGMRRRVNERLAGRTIRCPQCEKPLTIPELPLEAGPLASAETMSSDAIEVDAEPVDVEPVDAEPVLAQSDEISPSAAYGGSGARTLERAGVPTLSLPTGSAITTPVHHAEHAPSAFITDDEDEGVPPRKKREDGELDMTPMVDVTFLLLIFFMVTASFSLQKSIQMPRQNSDLPSMSNEDEPTEELDPIELEIDENGGFLVLTNEGENETPGKHNLINALKAAIGANKDGMRLDIKVHENAKLQMLVDGMDAGTIAGFTEIQVAEVDGFD